MSVSEGHVPCSRCVIHPFVSWSCKSKTPLPASTSFDIALSKHINAFIHPRCEVNNSKTLKVHERHNRMLCSYTIPSNSNPDETCSNARFFMFHGDDHPPATSTHSAKQLPSLPSTSRISVSQWHLQPTPFSLGVSGVAQYSSSSILSFSFSVVFSR